MRTRKRRFGVFGKPTASVADFATTTVSGQLVASGVSVLTGWSVRETTGTASAVFAVWDNPSAASGISYGEVTLGPNESVRDTLASTLGVANRSGGLYLQVLSGSVKGAVFYQ